MAVEQHELFEYDNQVEIAKASAKIAEVREVEVWRHIPDHPLYEVSNMGRVRRAVDSPKSHGTRPGKAVGTKVNSNGYPHFMAYAGDGSGKKNTILVHRAIADAFLPQDPDRPHINHIDGIKSNSVLNNIERVNRSENSIHAFRSGLHKTKVNEKLASVIRHLVEMFPEFSYTEISKTLGISAVQIGRIARCIVWNYDNTASHKTRESGCKKKIFEKLGKLEEWKWKHGRADRSRH